jgi:hypothetical protein
MQSEHNTREAVMKKILPMILCSALLVSASGGCSEGGSGGDRAVFNPNPSVVGAGGVSAGSVHDAAAIAPERDSAYDGPAGTWAVYWYLCGADLESDPETPFGAATMDLQEMQSVTLPENVTVVIETGGAAQWKNDFVSAAELGRYAYAGNKLSKVGSEPLASMGDPDTFADFLRYCNENYPAERQMVVLWDHGGGSLSGMEFDELFDNDSLSLPEFQRAIESVPAVSGAYEIVGFDACLMAAVDMVKILDGDARYLVASQEVEPGIGWNYEGFFNALAGDTSMGGAELCRAICDTFYEDCVTYRQSPEEATLSVVDLSRAAPLLTAFDAVGDEALMLAVKEKEAYLGKFGRAAQESKKFGGGNYEMVDLGDLASRARELLPENGAALLDALSGCVVYQVKGDYHAGASGLSCYYNLMGMPESADAFQSLGTSESFAYFHEYAIRGDLSPEAQDFINGMAQQSGETPPVVEQLTDAGELGLDSFPVSVNAKGRWQLNLGLATASKISSVYVSLAWVDPVSGLMASYGTSANLDADYENGVFTERFTDTWGCIDDMQVYMTPIGEEAGRVLYAVPIMLNGEEYTLHAGYDASSREYEILGAWKDGDNVTKAASKTLRQLQPGDVVEPIHMLMPLRDDGSRSVERFPLGMLTVTADTRFYERNIGDGYFALFFNMVDYAGNPFISAQASFRVRAGKIERLPGGIAPMTAEQPEGSIRAQYLQKQTFRHTDRNEDLTYYTAVLTPEMYQSMKEELGLPNPQAGDLMSGMGYTIQMYSDTLDLEQYVGAREFYISGIFFPAETMYHQRDVVMRVDEIVDVW